MGALLLLGLVLFAVAASSKSTSEKSPGGTVLGPPPNSKVVVTGPIPKTPVATPGIPPAGDVSLPTQPLGIPGVTVAPDGTTIGIDPSQFPQVPNLNPPATDNGEIPPDLEQAANQAVQQATQGWGPVPGTVDWSAEPWGS